MAAPVIAAWVVYASIAAGVASAAYTAYAGYQQGQANKAIAEYNAREARRARDLAVAQGQAEEAKASIAKNKYIAQQKALLSASGAEIESGTPSLILDETAQLADLDVRTIEANAYRRAWGFEDEAQMFGIKADVAQQQSILALGSGVLNVGSTALGGYTDYKLAKG